MSKEKAPKKSEHTRKNSKRPAPGFTIIHSQHEIKNQKANLELIQEKKPYIKELFQKSQLLQYLGKEDSSISASFINTYFYGLLTKESSGGTNSHHLKTASRQVQTKKEFKSLKTLPGTKIPIKVYEKWRVERNKTGSWPTEKIKTYKLSYRNFLKSVIKISRFTVKDTNISTKQFKKFLRYNPIKKVFLTPVSELQKHGIKSHKHLKQLVQKHYINKGPFQLIGNTLTDIRQVLSRKNTPKSITDIWSSKATPTRKHLESFDSSAKLSVINLERIYQYCRKELNHPYLKARKKGVVTPVVLMCYLAGMGKAKKVFKLAIKKKFKSKPLQSLLEEAVKQGIIKADRLDYIKKIRGYAFQMTPQLTLTQSQKAEQAKQAKQKTRANTKKQLKTLKAQNPPLPQTKKHSPKQKPVKQSKQTPAKPNTPNKKTVTLEQLFDYETQPNIQAQASLTVKEIRDNLRFMTFRLKRTELKLANRPYFDPDYKPDPDEQITSDEFAGQPGSIRTNADYFMHDKYKTFEEIPRPQLVWAIIHKYNPKFSVKTINNQKIETYTFPYGIDVEIRHNLNTQETFQSVNYSKNIKDVYGKTHLNYYNEWPNDDN